MNIQKAFAVIIICSIVFMGCPYSASVPIDTPSVHIDSDLLGLWRTGDNADSKCTYNVLKENEFTYKIEEKKDSGKVVVTFGFISIVDKNRYINIQDTSIMDKPYSFYKYEKSPDGKRISLIPVTSNIRENFKSSKELYHFIQKNQKNSYFFNTDTNQLYRCQKP